MRKILISFLVCTIQMTVMANAGTIQLPRTGQTICYDTSGAAISCSGAGQDGALQKGVAWPNPRFTDNNDGTVTDNLTGLVWLKKANCTDKVGNVSKTSGYLVWADAIAWSNALSSGACGLTDNSTAGQWQLPNRKELQSLVDRSKYNPALPAGHPFTGVQANGYWSSSSYASVASNAWYVGMDDGVVNYFNESYDFYVWPVRVGQ